MPTQEAQYYIHLIESRIPKDISLRDKIRMLCNERDELMPLVSWDSETSSAVRKYIQEHIRLLEERCNA